MQPRRSECGVCGYLVTHTQANGGPVSRAIKNFKFNSEKHAQKHIFFIVNMRSTQRAQIVQVQIGVKHYNFTLTTIKSNKTSSLSYK